MHCHLRMLITPFVLAIDVRTFKKKELKNVIKPKKVTRIKIVCKRLIKKRY